MPVVKELLERSRFVQKYVKAIKRDTDIFSAVISKGNIHTFESSARDFMLIFGEHCIESLANLSKPGHHLYIPQEPASLEKTIARLISASKTYSICDEVSVTMPFCMQVAGSRTNHWALLTLTVNNQKIIGIEFADSCGRKFESNFVTGFKPGQLSAAGRLDGWCKDIDPGYFAENCRASEVIYAEQNETCRYTCMDRMIINLLRKTGKMINSVHSYDLNYDAYSGDQGAKKLREVTASLLAECLANSKPCELFDISVYPKALLEINHSFTSKGLPAIHHQGSIGQAPSRATLGLCTAKYQTATTISPISVQTTPSVPTGDCASVSCKVRGC